MKRNLSYVAFLLICLMVSFGDTPIYAQSDAEKAKDYFDQGAYDEALIIWYELVESGNTAAGLYFNIGLAESGLNHSGKAMLAYEQALRISPGNQAIRKAIATERENILNATIPVQPFFLKVWYTRLVMLFRPGVWAVLGLGILVFLLFRFLIFLRMNPADWAEHLKRLRSGILIAGLLLLLAFLSYAELHKDNEAIIGQPCTFHQAPSEDSPGLSEIGPGEKVIVVDQIGDWNNVYLLNQDAGWVRSECLMPIRIGQK